MALATVNIDKIIKVTSASSYVIAILSVFIFADGGAGVGIHTTVHILGRVSGTGNRHPIPMDRVPTVSYQLFAGA